MLRQCTHCHRAFVAADLAREESRGMESERKAAGLVGVRFLYYRCRDCGTEDIFIDILPRDGEAPEEYATRYAAMQAAARGLPGEKKDVVVVPVKPPPEATLETSTSE